MAVGLGSVLAGAWVGLGLWQMVVGALLGWQLLLLALLDLRHFWLPNRLVAILALTGLGAGWLRWGISPDLATFTVAGGLLGFGLLWTVARLYQGVRGREGLGAGDPKLLGAIGLWVGPLGVVEVLLGASIVGLIGVAGMMLAGRDVDARTAVPLGSCLALAGWLVWIAFQGFS